MIGLIILAAMLQGPQGPKSLDIDPSKVQPAVAVPAGTVIPVTLTSRVTTKNAHDGDGIYGKTAFPVTVNNKIVIPEGSHVRGKISEIRRPGRVKGKAELTLNFQTLVLPSGLTIPIYTSLGGAAVGTAAVLLTRGKDLVLEPGTTIEIVLDRPIEP